MSEQKKDGGPAFPLPLGTSNCAEPERSGGLSMRDYFAAKVDVSVYTPLETFLSKNGRKPTISEMAEYVAVIRYIEADAMIATREQ